MAAREREVETTVQIDPEGEDSQRLNQPRKVHCSAKSL